LRKLFFNLFKMLELLEKIADGTGSEIWRIPGNKIAKIIDPNIIAKYMPTYDPYYEFNLMKSIHHSGIPRYYSIEPYVKAGLAYIAIIMDEIIGQDLQQKLPSDDNKVMTQLVDILQYLHHRNIAHRDIKPSNIMYDGFDVSLIDFGTACVLPECKGILGSAGYQAPEVVNRVAMEDKLPSDIYSLGMVYYYLLKGNNPLHAMDWSEIREWMKQKGQLDFRGIPLDKAHLIQQMISHNPQIRPTIDEVRQRLHAKSLESTPIINSGVKSILRSPTGTPKSKRRLTFAKNL